MAKIATQTKIPTQRERVLQFIQQNGGITSMDAYEHLGVTQLGARIHELEHKDGHTFTRRRLKVHNRYGERVDVTRYELAVAE